MSKLSDLLAGDKFVLTGELAPPKGIDLAPLFERAALLAPLVDAVNVTDSHGARMSLSPVAAGRLLRERGLEPIVQFTTRDRNRIALQSDLLGAAALGLPNVLFMGGDPPANGDHPQAKPVFDLFAADLLRAASALGGGHDLAGNALAGPPPRLCAGAVVNPGAADLDRELERMGAKVEAGAAFFQTQAVFDVAAFEAFMRRAEGFGVPVLGGVILVKSVRMAQWLNDKVPGITVPEPVMRRLADAADPRRTCVEVAAETLRELPALCRGAHLMALGWEELLAEVVARADLQAQPLAS